MGAYNTAKTHVGAALDTAGTWAKNKGAAVTGADWSGMGTTAKGKWGAANTASAGFLNPTSMGMGVGGAVGGAYGAASDDTSVLGGMAGGAMLGGLGGAGYRGAQMGFNKYKTGHYTVPHAQIDMSRF